MEYIHVKNLEKYHPGYKDRSLIWCKTYFKMVNCDPEFEMLCETDKWRFVALVMLELQIKDGVPLDEKYLQRKGFNLKKRSMSLTLQMLRNSVEVRNDSVTENPENVTQSRVEESRVDKDKSRKGVDFPDYFDSPTFQTAWQEWVQYRKETRHSLTPSTIAKQLKMFVKFTEVDAVAMITNSIEKGYQGLFPGKERNERDTVQPEKRAGQRPASRLKHFGNETSNIGH